MHRRAPIPKAFRALHPTAYSPTEADTFQPYDEKHVQERFFA